MKPPMRKPTPATKTRAAPKKTPAPAPMPGVNHMADDMKWKAQDALSTLKRAHEIKNDPALMEHVKKHAATERDVLASVMRRKT